MKILRFFTFFRRKELEEPKKPYHKVDQLYADFRYVIQVNNDHHEWWHPFCPFEEAKAWARDHSCEILVDRVIWDSWMQRWTNNEIGGGDYLFFATNDEDAATMTTLRWS